MEQNSRARRYPVSIRWLYRSRFAVDGFSDYLRIWIGFQDRQKAGSNHIMVMGRNMPVSQFVLGHASARLVSATVRFLCLTHVAKGSRM
jgi:hypothetical protein